MYVNHNSVEQITLPEHEECKLRIHVREESPREICLQFSGGKKLTLEFVFSKSKSCSEISTSVNDVCEDGYSDDVVSESEATLQHNGRKRRRPGTGRLFKTWPDVSCMRDSGFFEELVDTQSYISSRKRGLSYDFCESLAKRSRVNCREEITSGGQEDVPSGKQHVSYEEQGVPSEEQGVPSEEQEVPSEEQEVPSEEQEVPSEEQEVPSEEQEVPPEEQGVPSEHEEALEGPPQSPIEKRLVPGILVQKRTERSLQLLAEQKAEMDQVFSEEACLRATPPPVQYNTKEAMLEALAELHRQLDEQINRLENSYKTIIDNKINCFRELAFLGLQQE